MYYTNILTRILDCTKDEAIEVEKIMNELSASPLDELTTTKFFKIAETCYKIYKDKANDKT